MSGNGKPKSTRQAVVDCLAKNGRMCLSQISGAIKRPKSNVHKELGRLLTEQRVYLVRDGWALVDAVPRYPKTSAWTKGERLKESWWT